MSEKKAGRCKHCGMQLYSAIEKQYACCTGCLANADNIPSVPIPAEKEPKKRVDLEGTGIAQITHTAIGDSSESNTVLYSTRLSSQVSELLKKRLQAESTSASVFIRKLIENDLQ